MTAFEWTSYLQAGLEQYELTCPQRPVYPSVLLEAKQYAVSDRRKAISIYRRAQTLEPGIDLDPSTLDEKEQDPNELIQKAVAEEKIRSGARSAAEGQVDEAVSLYTEAQGSTEVTAAQWDSLCWSGSLHRQAADVMFACEKAVELDPEDVNIRDSRGLARALTGDTEGAVEDFQAFVDGREGPEVEQRQAWIQALEAGRDPFTGEVLNRLLQE